MKFVLVIQVLLLILFADRSHAQDEKPSWQWSDEEIEQAVNKVRAGRDLTPKSWPGGA
jgi:hypothetical protein